MSYNEKTAADARFIVLRELTKQPNGTLNELTMAHVLKAWGIDKTREWIRTQVNALAELGAVEKTDNGTIVFAKISTLGRDHVAERTVIDGVTAPHELG